MNVDALIAQLQVFAGGAFVMSTAQLANCLSMNPKVISKMRQERRFPIKEKLIGTKIVYTLDAVANYLLEDGPEPKLQQTQVKKNIAPEKKRASNKQAPIQDLSRKMLRMAFVSSLENQIRDMEEITIFFRRKMASENFEGMLPVRKDEWISRPDKP